ncbi:uncharacterized protein [Oryza sativa Japonica Group]|uniref:Os02g0209400 protein n=3 Tax=Oryza TaxID=4527 RepID=Q6H8D3_ORYSJ|nr:uncharacterized protein LOC4328696 [Oryza sativa Japonica Group]XP_052145212.1 uncharacterized protein LOC127764374 [Oryza glaberrima]KAB8086417.1 hypothetical protein EE612_009686 [Oryza sativa]KAF2943707.1 hypothetical protein DAI22_02g084500 [Oryza sativa Japonica Group]BAD25016.1 unknown protein [Oryza sativa Japonica Group]BAF08179.1 Os02g0209400 [Oryza sativa Japonica Group]BAG98285.1 unnamed protein product [Oryza sativa Japonica Group]|eukprot:NP_001046265.1 Os02g0209400 [Oryza sativa Japonica Group]
MTVRSETGGAATTTTVVVAAAVDAPPPWRLRRQRSVPAAVVATFAPCVGIGGHHAPRRVLRLGGNKAAAAAAVHHRRGEAEEEGEYFDSGGGVGVLRALWRRIVRGRRWKVMSRSGSSTARRREQYAQDEYEQNFDEGAAAAGGEPEPEYLSRSFSARYAAAGGGRRSAGLARFGVSRAN